MCNSTISHSSCKALISQLFFLFLAFMHNFLKLFFSSFQSVCILQYTFYNKKIQQKTKQVIPPSCNFATVRCFIVTVKVFKLQRQCHEVFNSIVFAYQCALTTLYLSTHKTWKERNKVQGASPLSLSAKCGNIFSDTVLIYLTRPSNNFLQQI